MKKIVAVSILVLGLAGCTAREQQLVAVGVVGALAGTVVASGVSESYHRPYYQYQNRPYYAAPHVYHHPRPAYNPYIYHAPRRHCFMSWERTPYGARERRVCN